MCCCMGLRRESRALWLVEGMGREADFSAAPFAKSANGFGRNDGFVLRLERRGNGRGVSVWG